MALHRPTFFTRHGSAIVFCIIMMLGLLWSEWAFLGLVLLILVLCLRDYFRLVKKIYPGAYRPKWMQVTTQLFSIGLLLSVAFAIFHLGVEFDKTAGLSLLFVPTLILLFAAFSGGKSLPSVLQAGGAMIYVTLPILMFLGLRSISIIVPLALILMIWMNDTMAYLVGSFIGKTPFSKISPKKTWEGTAGGAILTIAGAAIWGHYSGYYRMIDWIALALCAAIAGTAGDLLESKLKRLADVKDSGTMMPGHGGALDRFDSLLVATPFAFAYAYLFMPPLPLHIF